MTEPRYDWDVLVSYSNEDGADFAIDLCTALRARDVRVWIDRDAIEIGDEIRQKIDEAIPRARFAVPIISPQYFDGAWTRDELEGLTATERQRRCRFILPILHGVTFDQLCQRLPMLGNRRSGSSDQAPEFIADGIVRRIARSREEDARGAPGVAPPGMPPDGVFDTIVAPFPPVGANPPPAIVERDLPTTDPPADRRPPRGENRSQVPNPGEILELMRLLDHDSEEVREPARVAVLEIGWGAIGKVVERCAKDDRRTDLEVCLRALARFRADAEIILILNRAARVASGVSKRDIGDLRDKKRLELSEKKLNELYTNGRWSFEIESPLGQGLHVNTYRARDARGGMLVAIRVLRPEFADRDDLPAEFLRTALAARAYHHQNLISTLEADNVGDVFYSVRPFVAGRSLKDVLRQRGQLSWSELAPRIVDVCRALEPIHRAGHGHGGIKPSNIILDRESTARLSDPGLPISLATIDPTVPSYDYIYAAPELLRTSAETNPGADLYSLGCVVFECLTGRPAHPTDDFFDLLDWHQSFASPLDDVTLPTEAFPILGALLDASPTNRPRGLSEVIAAFEGAESSIPSTPLVADEDSTAGASLTLSVDTGHGSWETHYQKARDRAGETRMDPSFSPAPPPQPSPEPAPVPTSSAEDWDEFGTVAPSMQADPSIDDDLIGTTLNRKYEIVRKVGAGGFGSVYEAVDKGIGAKVAIKVVHPSHTRNPAVLASLQAEAKVVTLFNHPNIVRWITFDETEDGLHYFVMEFVEGERLDRLAKREGGQLSPERVVRILKQLISALDHIHQQGQLHLDVKPHNVLMTDQGFVKLMDFGVTSLAAAAEESSEPSAQDPKEGTVFAPNAGPKSPDVTRINAATPAYAPPEQLRHVLGHENIEELDARADLYSVGVVAFQLLTGELPRGNESSSHYHDLDRPPRKIRDVDATVPRSLAEFVDRCLATDRSDRYRDAAEALGHLDDVGAMVLSSGLGDLVRARGRGLLIVGAVIALATIIGLLWWWLA